MGFATLNTELIFYDLYETKNVLVSQTLFRHATSCAEAQCGHFEHFLQSSGGCNSEPMLQNACLHIIFFKLYCDVDLPSVG